MPGTRAFSRDDPDASPSQPGDGASPSPRAPSPSSSTPPSDVAAGVTTSCPCPVVPMPSNQFPRSSSRSFTWSSRHNPSGETTVVTGTPPEVQSGGITSWELTLADDLTLPLGDSHVANIGLQAGWFRVEKSSLDNAFGTWYFQNLDSLESGRPRGSSWPATSEAPGCRSRAASSLRTRATTGRSGSGFPSRSGLRADMLALQRTGTLQPVGGLAVRSKDRLTGSSGRSSCHPASGLPGIRRAPGETRSGAGSGSSPDARRWPGSMSRSRTTALESGTSRAARRTDDLGPPPAVRARSARPTDHLCQWRRR